MNTTADNGLIKYQGTAINHFYIENLDMLQGRYNLATQGIKAEDVAKVQVLENHEHVIAMQDQASADGAAINLKLKDKAKSIWSKSSDVGAGGCSDEALWDATIQTMNFGKAQQHLIRYSGDNMWRSYNVASSHYGAFSSDNSQFLSIVGHGLSPIGNSIFGYRHGINLNNLAKLSDSATINYNFNYSHNLSHGNSFSQTTYLFPDDSEMLLTEDIADRTHTNSANLQLTYEKNTKNEFLDNRLSISGLWNEGRGNIISNKPNNTFLIGENGGETSISQALHYRSLEMTNRTHLVHRTAKGRGFEWISTNSFSSHPQALAIGGNMEARQDIDITSISTLNSLEILRNIRAHKWTLSASTNLNAIYKLLKSELTHPDTPIATNGDMGHLRANVIIEPLVRYVNGNFQSTLRIPTAINYTSLCNTAVSGEKTNANRIHLSLQPSFSLLWKATDNFTFNANAKYSTIETPWAKLFTANVMKDYRTLSRYRATLDDNYSTDANIKVSFKDIFNSIFAHLEGGWKRSWSNIAYGTTLDEQAHTIIEAAYMPNHSNNYSLTAYGRKDINWHTMQVELSATITRSKNEILRQSVLTTYNTKGFVLRGKLAFDIVNGYRIDYCATWQRNRSFSANNAIIGREINQRGQLNLRILPSHLFFNLNISHTHNSSLASEKKDYLFIGGGLRLKISKKIELNLDGDNLTNIRTYTSRSIGEMEESYTEYHLRPLSITLTAHINI